MNRAERRTSAGFHHGHHYLRVAWHVENDSVQIRTATRDLDELTWGDRLHREKVSRRCFETRDPQAGGGSGSDPELSLHGSSIPIGTNGSRPTISISRRV